jgi:serine/threonine protein kinase
LQLLTSISEAKPLKFDEFKAMRMILSLTKAVVHCHEQGVVHRDIKLENLLLTKKVDQEACLKLSDFGLSSRLARGKFTTEPCGTLTYIAPEILNN